MLNPFTLTNIFYNHQLLQFGSGMGEPALGPLFIPQVPHMHTCKHCGLQV